MSLTLNRQVDHYIDQELRNFQAAAGCHIFKGAFVGVRQGHGYVRPLQAGDLFAGIAYEAVNNAGGDDGRAGSRVYTMGDFGLELSNAKMSDIGRPVYALDDEKLFLASPYPNPHPPREPYPYVGVVQDVVAPGEIILRLDTLRRGPR